MGRGWGLDPAPHGNSGLGIQQVKLQQVASLLRSTGELVPQRLEGQGLCVQGCREGGSAPQRP